MNREVIIILVLLFIAVGGLVVQLIRQMSALNKRVNQLTNNSSSSTIEDALKEGFSHIKNSSDLIDKNQNAILELNRESSEFINKFSLVTYNAYGDMGGNMSFILCLLNKENNGILLNSIHSRNGTRIYSKEIKGGEFQGTLSDEEGEALSKAISK